MRKIKEKILKKAREEIKCIDCKWDAVDLICCNCKTEFPIEILSELVINLTLAEVNKKIDEKIKIIRPSLSLKLTLEEQNERFFAINKLEELKKQVG